MPGADDLVNRERELLGGIRVWPGLSKRTFAKEYAKIELDLIDRFNKSKSATQSPSLVEIDGFVNRLADERRFILRPSLAVNYGILCNVPERMARPPDYQFVRVKGRRILERANVAIANSEAIQVEETEPTHLSSKHLKPDISLHDATEILLGRSTDLQTEIGRNIVLSLTSSLKDQFRLGGLTSALMPLDEDASGPTWDFLQGLKRIIPTDLTAQRKVSVRIKGAGNFEISPFSWQLFETPSLRSDLQEERTLLQRPPSLSWNELTIGVSASALAPKSLEELWIKRADLPAIIEGRPSSPWRGIYDLDLAKYLITTHTSFPSVELDVESDFKQVNQVLGKLRREYDHDGYAGLIDFDFGLGSPRSVLHLAEALARAAGSERVDQTLLREATSLFVESRRRIFEAWEERDIQYGSVSVRDRLKTQNTTTRQVYKHIAEHSATSLAELLEAFPKKQRTVIEECLTELYRGGAIYQSSTEERRYSAY